MASIGRKSTSIALENRYSNQADRDGWRAKRAVLSLQGRVKDLALSADPHLLPPALLYHAFTNGAVDEPAEVSNLELPGRAPGPALKGAIFPDPAGLQSLFGPFNPCGQEIYLPLHMNGDRTPSLLVTVNCLYGGAQDLGHLFLRLAQPFAEGQKLATLHNFLQKSPNWKKDLTCILQCGRHTVTL